MARRQLKLKHPLALQDPHRLRALVTLNAPYDIPEEEEYLSNRSLINADV
jgi:hypothetical protein